MRRTTAREEIRRAYAALEAAGLVLGHRVLAYRVSALGVGQAFRGRVESLDSEVTVRFDRAKWSDAFRVGDRVKVLHPGRHAVEAVVVSAAHGKLVLVLLKEEER